MKKQQKTNAARLLDQANVPYELVAYEVDENNLDAGHVAASLGEDINCVFKTLVLRGDRTGHFVCVVPGNAEVDLIPMKELLPTTGYIRGGCSPVGMKKPFPTFFHESCQQYEYIFVSAGMRGLQFKMEPAQLVGYVGASVADLIMEQ